MNLWGLRNRNPPPSLLRSVYGAIPLARESPGRRRPSPAKPSASTLVHATTRWRQAKPWRIRRQTGTSWPFVDVPTLPCHPWPRAWCQLFSRLDSEYYTGHLKGWALVPIVLEANGLSHWLKLHWVVATSVLRSGFSYALELTLWALITTCNFWVYTG